MQWIRTGTKPFLKQDCSDNLDAVTKDRYGYIYVTSFAQGIVYRFGSTFSAPPVIISTGHNGPSGLGYNTAGHIIGVTNYNSNSYSLITLPPISAKNISVAAESFVLFQNYPNPFNPVTKIKFSLVLPVIQAEYIFL